MAYHFSSVRLGRVSASCHDLNIHEFVSVALKDFPDLFQGIEKVALNIMVERFQRRYHAAGRHVDIGWSDEAANALR